MTNFQIWGLEHRQLEGCGPKTGGVRGVKISLVSGVGAVVLCTSESGNVQLSPNQDEIEMQK